MTAFDLSCRQDLLGKGRLSRVRRRIPRRALCVLFSLLLLVTQTGAVRADSASLARGVAAMSLERFANAEREFQAAIRSQDRSGGNAQVLTEALVGMAELRRLQGQYEVAVSLARRAYEEAGRLSSGAMAPRAGALRVLGEMEHLFGRVPAAIEACDRAVALLQELRQPATAGLAKALLCSGAARMDRLDVRHGWELLQRSLQIAERLTPRDPSLHVSVLQTLAMNARFRGELTGDFDEIQRFLAAAERVCRSQIGEPSLCVASNLMHRGELLIERGDADRGLLLMARGERMVNRLVGPNNPYAGHVLGTQAAVQTFRGEHDLAVQSAEAVQQRLERILGSDHRAMLGVRETIAVNLYFLGRSEEAERMQRDVVARARQSYLPHDRGLASFLRNLAIIQDGRGRRADAEASRREATTIRDAYFRHLREQFGAPEGGGRSQ